MLSAVFGLLGVIVGGLLTAGVEWVTERRARHRAQRLAARRLMDELAWTAAAVKMSLAENDWSRLVEARELRVVWLEAMPALIDLGLDDWYAVENVARFFGSLPNPDEDEDTTLDSKGRTRLKEMGENLDTAGVLLKRLSG